MGGAHCRRDLVGQGLGGGGKHDLQPKLRLGRDG